MLFCVCMHASSCWWLYFSCRRQEDVDNSLERVECIISFNLTDITDTAIIDISATIDEVALEDPQLLVDGTRIISGLNDVCLCTITQ